MNRHKNRGIAFRSIPEQMAFATPRGEFLFHVVGALTRFERSLCQQRAGAGPAAAPRSKRRNICAFALWNPVVSSILHPGYCHMRLKTAGPIISRNWSWMNAVSAGLPCHSLEGSNDSVWAFVIGRGGKFSAGRSVVCRPNSA